MTTKTWSSLNNKRKIAIQSILEHNPKLRETGEISLEELRSWWEVYRQTENRQIGYPIWLISEKDFRGRAKGKYALPIPTEEELTVVTSNVKPVKVSKRKIKDLTTKSTETTITVGEKTNEISDDEFAAQCRAAGITI